MIMVVILTLLIIPSAINILIMKIKINKTRATS